MNLQQQTMQGKEIQPNTRQSATLIQFYYIPPQAPPTSVTHKPKLKERRKGSRDFPFRVGPLLAAGVSRASSATCAPSARPLIQERFSTSPSARPLTRAPLVTLLRLLGPSAFPIAFQHERPAQDHTSVLTLVSTPTLLGRGPAFSSDTALRPFWACLSPLRQSGERPRPQLV